MEDPFLEGTEHVSSLAVDGRIKCGNCGIFRRALTYGKVYDVISEDLDKNQYQVKGCNGRKRWYPAYCFVPMDQPTPRYTSFQIDEWENDVVNVALDDGTQRYFYVFSLAHLAEILKSNPFFYSHATVFVESLQIADIKSIVEDLQNSGELLSFTYSLKPED